MHAEVTLDDSAIDRTEKVPDGCFEGERVVIAAWAARLHRKLGRLLSLLGEYR